MISIIPVDTKELRKRFVDFHYDLYTGCPQWVPPFKNDIHAMLNPKKHPFYDHSEADFFLAVRDGKTVGRIAALCNRPFNSYHNAKDAEFYLFDCINDQEVANALLDTAANWARARGLTDLIGPKGFGPLDGYGIQIEGFEHRQMMNLMNYNKENYPKFVENLGFTKVVDWVSSYADIAEFSMPEKIHRVAEKVREQGKFKVHKFKSKSELAKFVPLIGQTYNKTFKNNWEYYPLTQKEIDYAFKDVTMVAIPDLIKIITYKDEIVGFLLAFPDISAAFQRHPKGELTPAMAVDLLHEVNHSNWVDFDGIGVLPEYHGFGGNALLFDEIEKTAKSHHFEHGELTNIAETAVQMRKDLENLGVKPYKNHRIYGKSI